jgi:hypothetical protein
MTDFQDGPGRNAGAALADPQSHRSDFAGQCRRTRARDVQGYGQGHRDRDEGLRQAEAFRELAICASMESFMLELTGAAGNIDPFINLMRSIGLVAVSRTSVAAMSRGPNATLGRASPRLASQYLFRKMSLRFRRSGSSRDFGRHRQA